MQGVLDERVRAAGERPSVAGELGCGHRRLGLALMTTSCVCFLHQVRFT